jgi:chorismate synthase
MDIPRPSHADFAAHIKYKGFENFCGGGHFSGRITAAIVAAGAIVISALKEKGISIGTHIAKCAGVTDRDFSDYQKDIDKLNSLTFAVLDSNKGEEMTAKIESVRTEGDSVGGVLETAVLGLEAGIGEPWFDSLEGVLSHALFSIPGVKGVEFGTGFGISDMKGSEANDAFYMEDGAVKTKTNNSGGINGGISNGSPIIFRVAMRPTPTISKEQESVNLKEKSNTILSAKGRHDPCIVHRARVVVDSITAIALADMLALKYGTDWLGNK